MSVVERALEKASNEAIRAALRREVERGSSLVLAFEKRRRLRCALADRRGRRSPND